LLALLLGGALLRVPPVAGEEASKKEEGKGEGPTYIKLAPIVLPVIEANKVTRQVGLVLALELEPGKTEAEFEPNRRRLYDAFMADLYDLYDQFGGGGRVIEPTVIKQHLFLTSERILGPGFVHEVLIQQAYERTRG
jgi:flagellar FliL protein